MPCIVNDHDADMMFGGSLCEYDGDLLAVRGTRGDGHLLTYSILGEKEVIIPQDADAITSPLKWQLGFFQGTGTAVYLERIPSRAYKVGWSRNSIAHLPSVENLLTSKKLLSAFQRMLTQKYPTMEAAIESSARNHSRVACERQWAVENGNVLFYRNNAVAVRVDNKWIYQPEWSHIQQQVESLV